MELFSTEFYVLIFTLAACCVGLIVKPGRRGQAETSFAEAMTLDREVDTTPRVEFRCLSNGDVALIRSGLTGVTSADTVALAITRIGFDISIEERISPGRGGEPVERGGRPGGGVACMEPADRRARRLRQGRQGEPRRKALDE